MLKELLILAYGTLNLMIIISLVTHVFHLGSNLISWASKKQPIVSISSAEEEYVSSTSASCQAVWLRTILKDM
jgi:hypothetical protein